MKKGFTRNRKVIADILRSDPKLIAALKKEAEALAADSGGDVYQQETDRARFVVVVPAHEQAIDGKLTKAVGKRGKTLS